MVRTATIVIITVILPFLTLACGNTGDQSAEPGRSAEAAGETPSNPEVVVPGRRPALHPSFSITSDELAEIVANLRDDTRETILANPERFLDLLAQVITEPEELLLRVDREHPAPLNYEPPDIVALEAYSTRLDLNTARDHSLRELILPDLFEMVDDARAEGITLLISSAYRSYEYQEGVYSYWVDQLGQEEADRISARPGTSQHQLGTTVDFGCICDEFGQTPAGIWLKSNAWKYGFSLSYPDGYEETTGYAHESWHYRYLGRAAALMEHEYFGGIQHYLLEFAAMHLPSFASFLIEI